MYRASVVSVFVAVLLVLLVFGVFVAIASDLLPLRVGVAPFALWAGGAAWVVWASTDWMRSAKLADSYGVDGARFVGAIAAVGAASALLLSDGPDFSTFLGPTVLIAGASIWLFSESLILLRIIDCLPAAARTGFEKDLRHHRYVAIAVPSLWFLLNIGCIFAFVAPVLLLWQLWSVVKYHRRNAERIRWYLAATG